MKRHPRAAPVARAQTRIRQQILDMQSEYGLTDAEVIQALSMELASIAGFMIREERYPNGDPDAQTEEKEGSVTLSQDR